MGVNTVDVNGDGWPDLLTTANLRDPEEAYVFFGPFAGNPMTSDEADWTMSTSALGLGWDLVGGDFDGDGTVDLATGNPFSVGPGEVRVWTSPTPGSVSWESATAVLWSGVGVEDKFGMEIEVGDLDQDGRADLVIGAPLDPQGGPESGSVTIFYSAGLSP